ncbi:MAG: hypothetical protein RDV41_04010, partial [Planctomycetota bacterium]|nr:hypothetical protein [Planctomycetota bacterium]
PEDIGIIAGLFEATTDGSEASGLVFYTRNGGGPPIEKMRLTGLGDLVIAGGGFQSMLNGNFLARVNANYDIHLDEDQGTNPNSAVFSVLDGSDSPIIVAEEVNKEVGIGVASPHTRLHVGGPIATKVTVVNSGMSPYTVLADDSVLLVDTAGGAVTITMPTPVGIAGRQYFIKRKGANPVTVDSVAGNFDASSTMTLSNPWDKRLIVSDGTDWLIISQ